MVQNLRQSVDKVYLKNKNFDSYGLDRAQTSQNSQ